MWILVVISLYAGEPAVWPGATEGMLHRQSAVYSSLAACARDRDWIWARRFETQSLSVPFPEQIQRAICLRVPTRPKEKIHE